MSSVQQSSRVSQPPTRTLAVEEAPQVAPADAFVRGNNGFANRRAVSMGQWLAGASNSLSATTLGMIACMYLAEKKNLAGGLWMGSCALFETAALLSIATNREHSGRTRFSVASTSVGATGLGCSAGLFLGESLKDPGNAHWTAFGIILAAALAFEAAGAATGYVHLGETQGNRQGQPA